MKVETVDEKLRRYKS